NFPGNRASGWRWLHRPLPAVCELFSRRPGAPFAGSVSGVRRRRRRAGLGSPGAAAGARLQLRDSRERRPRVCALLAPFLLHIDGPLSHSLCPPFDTGATASRGAGPALRAWH
uniref:Uncharacterized protein n=1 Tax=Oryctolagus cuniculus TaxID=9986 RepID=A0A5F9C4R8_RABIT